jgi:hypothetical protein
VRESITGRTLTTEAEREGHVTRKADLAGVGDHLIEYESDSQARYLVKATVTPRRLVDETGESL